MRKEYFVETSSTNALNKWLDMIITANTPNDLKICYLIIVVLQSTLIVQV